jgi:hypothetical protein
MFFDGFEGKGKTRLSLGWGSRRDPYPILSHEFIKVTVNTFFATLLVPDSSNLYLRPNMIFEARALMNSLDQILFLLVIVSLQIKRFSVILNIIVVMIFLLPTISRQII